MLVCSLCNFVAQIPTELTLHVVRNHSDHPKFIVNCCICGGTWRKYDSFRKHVRRKYQLVDAKLNDDPHADVNSLNDNVVVLGKTHSELANEYANQLLSSGTNYLLQLKTVHAVSQTCVSDVISHTNELVALNLKTTREKLLSKLEVDNPDALDLVKKTMDEITSDINVFYGIHTNALQDKYCREHFNYLEPIAVCMGHRYSPKANNCGNHLIPVYGYTINFLENLKSFLRYRKSVLQYSNKK